MFGTQLVEDYLKHEKQILKERTPASSERREDALSLSTVDTAVYLREESIARVRSPSGTLTGKHRGRTAASFNHMEKNQCQSSVEEEVLSAD